MSQPSILVTGAGGGVGSVGFKIVQLLREQNIPVRAMVHRFDERSEALHKLGAEVVQGDLSNLSDLHRVIKGCKRIYFGMSVSDAYLQAALTTAAVAKHYGVELFVNMSQMTVSQMNIFETTESTQQKAHWLLEQALNWSGLPVVHLRPTVFIEHPFFTMFAAKSIKESGVIRLPFGDSHTSPIATIDVARAAVNILLNPDEHIGKAYNITGPTSLNMKEMAREFSGALDRDIKYVDAPVDDWIKTDLQQAPLSDYVKNHLATMARLHRENRYARFTDDFEHITGSKPLSVQEWVKLNKNIYI